MDQDELINEIESKYKEQPQNQQQNNQINQAQNNMQPQQQIRQYTPPVQQQPKPLPPESIVPRKDRNWLDVAAKISYIVLAIATAFIAIIMIWGSLR